MSFGIDLELGKYLSLFVPSSLEIKHSIAIDFSLISNISEPLVFHTNGNDVKNSFQLKTKNG
ncbi:hypothetical protein D3C85_1073370 [compost metagenome]